METSELDYTIPAGCTAQGPLPVRGTQRLMVLRKADGKIEHLSVKDLPGLVPGYTTWVNESRTERIRVTVWRDTGHRGEAILYKRISETQFRAVYPQIPLAMDFSRRWRAGRKAEAPYRILERVGEQKWLFEFETPPDLDLIGELPIPPYATRPADKEEESWYEPFYARVPGGTAIPTAGVCISEEVYAALSPKSLVLHALFDNTHKMTGWVDTAKTKMHIEQYTIPEEPDLSKPILAVGTTTVRALESWGRTGQLAGETDLFIGPGHEWKSVAAILTQFRFPGESHMFLGAAMAGAKKLMTAYQAACDKRYSFGDFGDALLIV